MVKDATQTLPPMQPKPVTRSKQTRREGSRNRKQNRKRIWDLVVPVLPLAAEHDGMLWESDARGVTVTLVMTPAELQFGQRWRLTLAFPSPTLNCSQGDTMAENSWSAVSNVMMSPSAPSSMFLIIVNVTSSSAFIFPSTSCSFFCILFFSCSLSRQTPYPPISLFFLSPSARVCLQAHLTKRSAAASEPPLTWHVCGEQRGQAPCQGEGRLPCSR